MRGLVITVELTGRKIRITLSDPVVLAAVAAKTRNGDEKEIAQSVHCFMQGAIKVMADKIRAEIGPDVDASFEQAPVEE